MVSARGSPNATTASIQLEMRLLRPPLIKTPLSRYSRSLQTIEYASERPNCLRFLRSGVVGVHRHDHAQRSNQNTAKQPRGMLIPKTDCDRSATRGSFCRIDLFRRADHSCNNVLRSRIAAPARDRKPSRSFVDVFGKTIVRRGRRRYPSAVKQFAENCRGANVAAVDRLLQPGYALRGILQVGSRRT